MKTLKFQILVIILLVVTQFANASVILTVPGQPIVKVEQAKESVSADLKGYVIRNEEKVLAEQARPGEEIIWEMTLHNNASQEISNIKINGKVPEQTVFVKNSAENVEYSLDGKVFSREPHVRDEQGNLIPAPDSLIRAIRFTVSLQAGETKVLTYRTTVK